MDKKQFDQYLDIPKEKFEIVQSTNKHDRKFDSKPVGYFKDAFRRFCKNKASVIAAIIIGFLLLFAAVGPYVSHYDTTFNDIQVASYLPKSTLFSWAGWDGCSKKNVKEAEYIEYLALEQETGHQVIKKTYGSSVQVNKIGALEYTNYYFDIYADSYFAHTMKYVQLTKEQYESLQAFQDANNIQIIYPFIEEDSSGLQNVNIWYETSTKNGSKGLPTGYKAGSGDYENITFKPIYTLYDGDDAYTSKMRIEENGALTYNYAEKKAGGNYMVRLDYYEYFNYLYGNHPKFIFGSDQYGKDIFCRLASGARFSLLFAVCISAINLIIGAIWGAISGYYGGAVDMVMERVTDILSGIPSIVVVTLFKLHIADKVGTVATLLFAFVLTGWIGMAGTTRMQFYRYKNQEYVLAARTLGAKDFRIMFKHIFPNSLGTLVTSCVLVIPGVIFSESSLSYLGIINLSTSKVTSVGTLLANGQGSLSTTPHIIFFPAAFISLLMITFNLFGNGLRDAFNPSLRGSEE